MPPLSHHQHTFTLPDFRSGFPARRDAPTLAEVLRQRAVDHGSKTAFTFIQDDGGVLQLSYAELYQAATVVALQLSEYADRGARALLLHPPGPDYVIAFFGCLLASVVAVPCYPPLNRRSSARVDGIVRDCNASLALVARGHTEKLKALVDGGPQWLEVGWSDVPDGLGIPPIVREPRHEELCFLQYTSGSTGAPKGVRVTHRSLMANLEQIRRAFRPPHDFVGVSWLPPYHDMGLIGGLLEPVYAGGHHVILSPASFLQQPMRWLRHISDYRAAYAGGPNFAFELCARRATEEQKAGLDLSSWRVAFCGAEPLRADTLDRFVDAFASCGLRRDALLPCYGLAEATLLVTAQRAHTGPVYRMQEDGRRQVSSGEPGVGVQVAIVDPSTCTRVEPGAIGEIWVAGDNVVDGYWANEEATRKTFDATLNNEPDSPQFLRTGDLGSVHDGQLFVAGRLKDVLILGGRNVYPQDVELASFSSHAGLRKDGAAAFSVAGDASEEMVVVQELEPRCSVDGTMIGSIAAAVFDETGVQPHAIVLVKAGGIPRTSSGKIRRSQCKADYESGRLPVEASRIAASQSPPAALLPSSAELANPQHEPSLPRYSRNAIEAWVKQQLGAHLGVDPGAIDADQSFAFHGVSSLLAVQLVASLGNWLGRPLSPTLLWDHPSVSQLASHLAGEADRAESLAAVGHDVQVPVGAAVEPIAVVGLACRFPGADDAQEFWALLRGGRDAVGPVPAARLEAGTFISTPGSPPQTRIGGFLRQVDQFDAHFFGLSSVEAERIDPQQRLVLEVAWEALEDAAIAPCSLAGSPTGVYVGISAHDYEQHQTPSPDATANLYAATGSAPSVAPNRLSYLLDLRGPSIAIDTACSSSLVSLHLACQALRHGETDLALAGGVNLILSDKASAAFAAAGMLAPDGRCKTFDEAANGYVRGEGCGVVVLKRLPDAQRDGDRVRAVILGSAVHQDGRSNGLVAPNGLAQAEVIRRALRHAGVSPAQIGYVEAHGTGTALGDPIEFNALKRVFDDSDAPPCAIGSVKSGIGHLEAAAGIAGVIKTILSLEHETIPPHLHFRRLNPNCSLQGRPFDVPITARPWPAAGGRRFAGVSSFGFGGTIAHVVLADAPHSRRAAAGVPLPYQVLPLSAKSASALERMTDRLGQALREGATSLADAAVTVQTGRDAFPHRRLLIGSDAADSLSRWAQRDPLHVIDRRSSPQPAPVAFMFPGQGAQSARMAWQLYRHLPVFRQHIDAGLQALEPALREELRLALFPNEGSGPASGEHAPLDRTEWAQPALFIVEHALAQLWIDCGIQPVAMIGHSLGEYVAACVAGVFTREEGVALVAERARLMHAMPGGAMVGVALDEALASTYCSEDITLAAVNAPQRCVLAGSLTAMDELMARLAADGVSHQRLRTAHAFHSPAMVPVRQTFRERVRAVDLRAPHIPYISNVTGTWITPEQATDPAYWARQLCEPVRFSQGLSTLTGNAPCTLIEVGPGAVLGGLVRQHGLSPSVTVLSSLGRDGASSTDLQTMLTSLGRLWLEGRAVQWRPLHRGGKGRRAALPAYPFERRRFWLDATPHPLLTAVPASVLMHTSTVAQAAKPACSDHSNHRDRIRGQLVAMVAELLRSEPERVDPDVHLIELGADSLLIVQAVRRIEQSFGVTLTIRQLFEELTTISRIAAYLAETLPEGPLPEGPLPAQHTPAPARDAASAVPAHAGVVHSRPDAGLDAVERVLSQQLHVMQLQLAALRTAASGSVTPLPSATPQVAEPAMPASPSEGRPREAASQTPQEGRVGKFVPYQPARTTMRFDPMRELQPRQREYLKGFIAGYVQRTRRSKEFTQRHRGVLADYRASAVFRYSVKEMLYPIACERSLGSRVWDVDGNEYIDLTMGFGVNLFGHRPGFIEQAMRAQMDEGWQLGPQSQLAGEVAQLVSSLTGMERVTFSNSGTEAVILALRLARLHTGRPKIAFFSGSYHGWGNDTIVLNDGARGTIAMAPGLQPGTAANTLVLDYGSPKALEAIRAHAHELAAILVEPVQSRLPEFQPRAFLHELRALTAQHGIALIFDEIITGFRLHPGGAQAFYGIRADMATYGKVAGGGMPIGMVAGAPHWLDGVDGGMWEYGDDSYPKAATTFVAGTFCKHPLTLAASRAALQRLRDEGPALQQALERRTAGLVERLNGLFDQAQLPVKAVHCGSLFRLHTQQNIDLLYYHAIAKGLYIWEGRSMFLSTAHSDADVDRVVEIFAASIRDLQEAGFFPPPSCDPSGRSGEPGPHSKLAGATSAPVGGGGAGPQAAFPLTAAQRGIWVECQFGDDAALAYNASMALRLKGPLQRHALHRAVAQVVTRHEALRTVIGADGDQQHVLAAVEVPLAYVDLSGTEDPSAAANAWCLDNNLRRFDLSVGPLLRTDLLNLAEQDHLLVISQHHVITDGISQMQLLNDIAQCYSAACDGVSPVLPRARCFANYVVDCERYLNGQRFAVDQRYWLNRFGSGVPENLTLPAAKNPGARPGSRVQSVKLVIDGERYARLEAAGRARGCTLFMTLLAAVSVLLYRLTGQDDFVLGVPMASGRDDDAGAALLGCTINLVPIRCQPHASDRFSEYLVGIKQVLLEAVRHADYPFGSLVKALQLTPDPGRRPLAPILVNLNRPADLPHFKGLECQLADVPVSFAQDELFIDALQLPGRLEVSVQYNTDFFDHGGIRRMIDTFDTLLDVILEDLDRPLRDLALLDRQQREQLLYGFNDTSRAYELQCVHHLFEAQVGRTPDAPVVAFENTCLSYRELNERANRLAHHLIALGVRPDSSVAIAMRRSSDLLVAVLGTWKAGGAYVPLDPDYPVERLSYMLTHSTPHVLLTDRACAERLPCDSRVPSVWLDDPDAPWVNLPVTNPCAESLGLQARHLAYVIYTSGSTGVPKGVMIEHACAVNYAQAAAELFGLTATDRVLQQNTINFDLSLEEMLPALTVGACLVLQRTPLVAGGSCEVSVVHLTSAHWHVLVGNWRRSPGQARSQLAGVRLINVTGDALSSQALVHWAALGVTTRLVNTYGPSETAVSCTAATLHGAGPVTIGRPLANVQVYVLDSFGQPVPVGVAGELCVGGVQVGRGYLGSPQVTAERFMPDAFGGVPGSRLYRTGDLARWRPDGTLEFLGRDDHQVKVQGFRIELGEIEACLLRQPDVREAVALVQEDTVGDKRLVAYVVMHEGQRLEPAATRDALRQKLPQYMVPAHIVALDRLPLTPNGKLDRKALPGPQGSCAESGFVAPRTPIEEQLARIWSEVLRVNKVGVHDDFFELGGHSLRMIEVLSRIRAVMGLDLPLRVLFEAATVERQARHIETAQPTRVVRIEPVPTQADYEVSAAQRRLWLLQQLDPLASAYHAAVLLNLPEWGGKEALERALTEVLRRHEVLRTAFVEGEDGWPRQQLRAPWDVKLAARQFESEAALQEHFRRFSQEPFDLAHGPLFRAEVLSTFGRGDLLAWCMHEIVADGSSQSILEREIKELLRADASGEQPRLSELPIQYKDYAAWQNSLLRPEGASRHYWHEQLDAGMAVLQLPYDWPLTPDTPYSAAQYHASITGAAHQALTALCRRHQSTMFMLLQASLAVWLARLTGQDDIVIAIPASLREACEAERLIGFFLNTVLLRMRVQPDQSFEQVLGHAREVALNGLQHQHYPFEQLIEELDLPRPKNQFPVTPVLLNVLSYLEREPLGQRPSGHEPLEVDSKVELQLTVQEHADGLAFACEYRTGLFKPQTIEYLIQQWLALLDEVSAEPGQRVDTLAVFADERARELRSPYLQFAGELPAAPPITSVLSRIAQRAVEAPDAVAIEWQDRRLTYAQLQACGDRIAGSLLQLGCERGDVVALLLPDPIEHIAAVLGTMKAGAVFMTLDAGDPPTRLQTLVQRVQPRWWIAGQDSAEVLAHVSAGRPAPGLWLGQEAVPGLMPLIADPRPIGSPPHADSCYLFFTSGSTGQPKPILGRAQSLAQFVDWEIDTFGLQRGCRVSQLTAPTFDAWLRDVFVPLCAGGTVCVPPQRKTEPDRLLAWLDQSRVELVHCVPSVLRVLLAYAKQTEEALPALATLRRVCLSGEPVQPALVQGWHTAFGERIELINFYGASETTMIRCWHRIARQDPERCFIPIGQPIAHTQAIVLDGQGQPCAAGTPGEIWLRSRFFTLGYYQDEARTAEVFVPNPLRPGDDLPVYRSGDLGVMLDDGSLRCLGRRDGQVKVNGVRIEVGEIENALMSHPQVREAAVIAYTGDDSSTRLSAHVACDVETVEDLHRHLAQRLPATLLPHSIIPHEALPLTSSGKIDRKALAARNAGAATEQAAYVAPATDTERMLAQLYGQVLGRERIGRDDDFFALGGHSLQALTLLARIRKSFDMQLALRTLFETRTVRGLAEAVDAVRVSECAATKRSLGIERVEEQADYEVSAAQRRLWLLHQLDPGSTAYHVPALLELSPGVGRDALQGALSQVLARHEALRTVIVAGEEGMPRQRVQPAWPVEVSERRIDDAAALQSHHERFISEPFDLSHGPLFRAEVLHTWDGRQLLAWCMHEIISDGSSAVILEREVRALLKGDEAAGALGALPIQYKDFAAWQNRRLRDEDASRQYWHEQFSGDLVRLELPYDRPPSAQVHTAAAQYPVVITGAAHQALLGLCKTQQVTLAMLLQAAVAAWLARLTGRRDIVLAVPASGRDVSEVEPLIGFFLNTVLLRIPVEPEASFEQVLGESRQVTLNGLQHQHYPFEQLLEELDLPRPQNQFPVTPVLFNVLNFLERDTRGEEPAGHQPKTLGAKAELEFTVLELVDGLLIRCDYRTALFEPSTIEYLMQQLQSLLNQVGQAPERDIAALDVFADARAAQLRSPYLQFANELPAAPALPGVLERFALQAQIAPEAIAIEWQDRQCTYAQLQAHSDRIARQLQALGCCIGDIVALLLPDPIEHLAAVLGTMKAGAVFMTLDLSHPVARLQTLVARVAPRWWIAEHASAEVLAQLGTSEVQGLCVGETEVPGLTPLTAEAAPVVPPADADACYIYFTSGSTGQPKPILGRAQSLAQFVDWEISTFDLKRGCRVSQITAPTFDAWLRDVFVPLCAGGTVCVPPQRKPEPDRLLAWLDRSQVELVHCVPSVLRALLAYAKQTDEALPALATLKRVCLSGEPVQPVLVEAWYAAFNGRIELINFYGASETTMIRCWHRIARQDVERGFIPIGRPIAHTQAIVLDGEGQACAPGVPGEIWLRSRFFTLGYYQDEARTAEVFVRNPLRPQDEERVYRSGDIGVLLDDGSLRCLGRRDGQVKVNGVRIEVGEVENALLGHPQVSEAAVVAQAGDDGQTRLSAYVVAAGAHAEDLLGHLAQRLPDTMLPYRISVLESLPLTSSGKIDRKALLSVDGDAAEERQAAYVAPETDTERAVAGLFKDVLGRERIGRDDDFFVLGGHSLQALMLLARLRSTLRADLPLRALFEERTVQRLARAVDVLLEDPRQGADAKISNAVAEALAQLDAETSLVQSRQDA